MNTGKVASIIGATGLIGSHLLDVLLKDDEYRSIRLVVRRPFELSHPKIAVDVIDFSEEKAFEEGIAGSDIVFCAVGTTQAKVKGDIQAYRKVDHDIPVTAARLSAKTGVKQFLLVSSVGALSRSKNFYLKLKGEVEDKVVQQSISSIWIFRPSLLLGDRKEFRPAERIGQALMSAFSFLIPSKYKPVRAKDVALSMVFAARKELPGIHILEYREMQELVKNK